MQKEIESIPAAVMKALGAWEWPGDVRDLENFVERAAILTRGRSLTEAKGRRGGRSRGALADALFHWK